VPADDPLSKVFSALADPLRRDLVARLASGDATVRELAEPYPVSAQAVSKHLRVLEEAGLVTRTRDAQRRPAHLEAEVFDLMTLWIERHRRTAEFRYRRLDEVLLVEQTQVDDTARLPVERTPRFRTVSERVFEPWDLHARAATAPRAGDAEPDEGAGQPS